MERSKMIFNNIKTAVKQHLGAVIFIIVTFLVSISLALLLIHFAFQRMLLTSIAMQNTEFAHQADALSGILQTTISGYGNQIFYDPTIAKLRSAVELSDEEKQNGIRALSVSVDKNDFVDSVSIYNQHEEFVFTNDPTLPDSPIEDFADRSTADIFSDIMRSNRMTPIRRICENNLTGKRQRYYSFIFYETDDMEQSLKTGALIVNIPYKWYESQLLSFDTSGTYVILDSTGRIIACKNDSLQSSAALFWYDIVMENRQHDTDSYMIRKIRGEKLVCLYSRMNSTGWYSMRIMPLSECIPGFTQLHDSFILTVAIVLFILMLVSGSATLFIYYPLLSIKSTLKGADTLDNNDSLSTLAQVTELVEISRLQSRSKMLNAMLAGNFDGCEEVLPPMILALFDPMSASQAEVISQRISGVYAAIRVRYSLLLFTERDPAQTEKICRDICSEFGCRCIFSLPRDDVRELSDCLSRLLQIQALSFRFADEPLIYEEAIALSEQSSFSKKSAQCLVSALKQGEKANSQNIFYEILTAIKDDNLANQQFAINRVNQLLSELCIELDIPSSAIESLPNELSKLSCMAELTDSYDKLFEQITNAANERHKKHIDDISAKAAQFITQNYSDTTLSAAQIAELLNLSTAYLGRLFHASYSMSISEYINRTRVEHACELLKTTSLSIEAITQEIGFENGKYFFVVFKNIMGCTP
ncbi:MAG: AraC family transcriptional regulator, partial [Oscillospiraceae bacterium]|nr:AraC family transcriptional regulator [Oscillospiraceae bacterium]